MKEESFVILAAVKFQLIDIEPAKLRITDPNHNQLVRARELADELIRQLKAGKDFLELAKEYPRVTFAAPSKPVQPSSLRYSILADEAEKLEPGDVSGLIETLVIPHLTSFLVRLG